MHYSRSSKNSLNPHSLKFFQGETLFDRIGRAVCEASCLNRKEFFESWESAKRINRQMRGGDVLELAAGHGFLSMVLLLLDSSRGSARLVDRRKPPCFDRLYAVLSKRWPALTGRLEYRESELEEVVPRSGELVVSVHACGVLTDRVLDKAIEAGARVAVVPCCHDLRECDTGGLTGWIDGPAAVDIMRVGRLRGEGFRVAALTIPEDITPKNRLLMGWPPHESQE